MRYYNSHGGKEDSVVASKVFTDWLKNNFTRPVKFFSLSLSSLKNNRSDLRVATLSVLVKTSVSLQRGLAHFDFFHRLFINLSDEHLTS
jgi:hypothetical protein